MPIDASNRSGAWVRAENLDQVNASLRALADSAVRAEGAFARLVGQVTAQSVIPEAGGTLQGLLDDLVRGIGVAGDYMEDGILRSNRRAADRSLDVWDQFGARMAGLFGDLFERVVRDGETRFSTLFRSVLPIVTDLFRHIAGSPTGVPVGLPGGSMGGLLGTLLGGSGAGSPAGSTLGTLIGAGGPLIGMVAGGGGPFGGVLGGGLGGIGTLNPYVAGALALAQIVGPALFAPRPSVGPTTVARVFPSDRNVVYSTDNDGNPNALIDTVEAIFDGIERVQSRFGGVLNGNGFDVGYFPAPEDGSGQTGGYNFKAIIGAHVEDEDRLRGLSEAELIAEAVKFIVREGLDGIDVPEVAEAARHSVADSLEDLFDDLLFADRFGTLRVALEQAGQGVDAYSVALQRQRLQITEAGRSVTTDGIAAIRDFLDRAMTLFPGEASTHLGANSAVDLNATDARSIGRASRVLYQMDEGAGRFGPGVTGVYDDSGGLTGLKVDGTDLPFVRSETDEGRPSGPTVSQDLGVELIGGAVTISGDALRALIETATELGQAVRETSGATADYLANQARIRDAFAIAAADVDALVERIAGGFEPETIGPFEERLIAGNGAVEQLRSELLRMNEDIAAATEVFPALGVAALDVAAIVGEATELLQSRLQEDYRSDVARDLRAVQGLEVQDGVADLGLEYRGRRADGQAIGITDFSDLDALYRARLRALLDGADDLAGVLGEIGASFATLVGAEDLLPDVLAEMRETYSGDLDRDVRIATGLGIVDDVSARLSETTERRAVGAALGVEDFSGLDTILGRQLSDLFASADLTPAAIDALRTTFSDNALVLEALADALDLNLDAANDNVAAQLSLADAARLASREIAEQIRQQEQFSSVAGRVVDSMAEARRRIAVDANLSPLSPAEQLAEGRRFFESLADRSAEGDQEAQLDLGAAALDYLQLAREFYASNQDYARIFSEVDGVLGDTQSVAERQLDVAEAQLRELERMSRALTGDLSGVPNPNADFGLAPTRNRVISRLTGYAGDFGSGGFSAFRSGLSDEVNRAVDLLVQTIPFAAGGIMTAQGPVPLHRYARGGVARTPQLALFGEGSRPEAFVPLPDGRTIPVTLAQSGFDGPAARDNGDALIDLLDETRRVTAAINGLRLDNTALRRGLDRILATSRGAGRAA